MQIFFPIEVHTRGSHLPLTAYESVVKCIYVCLVMLLQAALMRLCGVVSSSTLQIQTEEIGHNHHRHCSQQQRQLQHVRQHLFVFIAPADTCGRRQGILLPKKLLQLFVLRRLGWEVR